jgi:hypothetical protein
MLARDVSGALGRMRMPPKWRSKAADGNIVRNGGSIARFLYDWVGDGVVNFKARESAAGRNPCDVDDDYSAGIAQLRLKNADASRFTKENIFTAYGNFCQRHIRYAEPELANHFWQELKKCGFCEEGPRLSPAKGHHRTVVVPPLPQARAALASMTGRSLVWEDYTEEDDDDNERRDRHQC